jgi:hypothetical protein
MFRFLDQLVFDFFKNTVIIVMITGERSICNMNVNTGTYFPVLIFLKYVAEIKILN